MYVEVLVNKWPRIFIITLNDIEAGEELLIDYGASYWEKLSLSIMKGKLEKANSRNAELEAHIDTLREQLKTQEATWGGQ
jgi:SET domain-containing protein